MPVVSPKESSDLLAKLESPTLIFWEALDYFLCRWQPEGSSRFQAACYLLLALEVTPLLIGFRYPRFCDLENWSKQFVHDINRASSRTVLRTDIFILQAAQELGVLADL